MELKFQVLTKIMKPVEEVFDAVVNPAKLSGYFTKTATPMKAGETAIWTFPEFEKMEVEVKITQIVPKKLVAFSWDSMEGGYQTHVEIHFEPKGEKATLVKIKEWGWKETEKGLKSSYGNCQGWMHMTCCMKAFLEFGINLRQDSMPEMKDPQEFIDWG
jgi:uncharacterized protein YndB with AHSA1/START domain